ncbi:hypothetical protein HRbin36_00520 [bacterium HR36]|nr:hypothetical protein HRbin36_00520 [bacterium HR36]
MAPILSTSAWLVWSVVALADTQAIVTCSTVAQSGPGTMPPYYATSRLEPGQAVSVLGETSDFYAIRPPSGSFSYVACRAVRLVPGQPEVGVVHEAVATLVGSELGSEASTDGVQLSPGTLVRILGQDHIRLGQQMLEVYRIEPLGEKRFVRKSAVSLQQSVVEHQPANPPQPFEGLGSGSVSLRQQANLAYERGCQTGDFTEAKRLYRQLSQASDAAIRWEALNRLEFIRLREREAEDRLRTSRPVLATAYVGQPDAGQTRSVNDVDTIGNHLRVPGLVADSVLNFRSVGVLRRSALTEDGRPLYFLEDRMGRLRCYLQLSDAIAAEKFVNRVVEVSGQALGYRSGLRADLVWATSIRPLE